MNYLQKTSKVSLILVGLIAFIAIAAYAATCSICNDTGVVDCKACNKSGTVTATCPVCAGAGKRGEANCIRCGGKNEGQLFSHPGCGTVSVPCPSCNGSGMIRCPGAAHKLPQEGIIIAPVKTER